MSAMIDNSTRFVYLKNGAQRVLITSKTNIYKYLFSVIYLFIIYELYVFCDINNYLFIRILNYFKMAIKYGGGGYETDCRIRRLLNLSKLNLLHFRDKQFALALRFHRRS